MNKLAKAFQYQALKRRQRIAEIKTTEYNKNLMEKWDKAREDYLDYAAQLLYKQHTTLEETIFLVSEKFAKQIVGSHLVETIDKAYKFAEDRLLSEPDIQEVL
jgi:hypothetical protein